MEGYVKGHGFLSFGKNMDKNVTNKYSQKLLDSAKKSGADATKTTSKRGIQKRTEGRSDFIGNKIADKITSVSKIYLKELLSQNEDETEIPKGRYISSEKRQHIIDELRLV